MKLFCAIVGEAESAFKVDIAEDASVSALKNRIKKNNKKSITCDAKDLQLFLVRTEDGGWLELDEAGAASVALDRDGHAQYSNTKLMKMESMKPLKKYVGELLEQDQFQVHVLVVVPKQTSTGKRSRGQDWFVDDRIVKKTKVDGGEIPYFTMDQFPRMAHPVNRYKKILERGAYRVIYEQLMGRVKESFETRSPANLVVTGNPGTGKSWFYLYCIFQLILGDKEEVEKLPAFDLVLNFDNNYQLYDAKTKEFIKLNEDEVDMLSGKDRVLRLVEAKSTHLVGWKGVSILFASPGLDGMNDYLKVDSRKYIMPVWTLEELQDYNSLLDDKLKLADDALIMRYDKFGGIARSVFAKHN